MRFCRYCRNGDDVLQKLQSPFTLSICQGPEQASYVLDLAELSAHGFPSRPRSVFEDLRTPVRCEGRTGRNRTLDRLTTSLRYSNDAHSCYTLHCLGITLPRNRTQSVGLGTAYVIEAGAEEDTPHLPSRSAWGDCIEEHS